MISVGVLLGKALNFGGLHGRLFFHSMGARMGGRAMRVGGRARENAREGQTEKGPSESPNLSSYHCMISKERMK